MEAERVGAAVPRATVLQFELDLLRSGRFEAAEKTLSGEAERPPVSLDVLHNLAVARYKLGRFEEAAGAA
ncbi:MAG: hypothetical protein MUQ26_01785, partial [Armatimonadetes bacterium]|nr:hypothetical protein [Armatimonadota bacterium]